MAYYIQQQGSRPLNNREFASVEEAFDHARQPAWAGAGPTDIIVTGETTYSYRGDRYAIVAGRNPKALREETVKAESRSAINSKGQFRGSRWLSREMDRADSDY